MPRMGNGRVSEKSKDFKGAVINLLKDMKSWHLWLLVAIILAFASSILALIAPDKLSGLTDIITEGIKPNTEKLEVIINDIGNNVGVTDEEVNYILTTDEISSEDKEVFLNVLNNIQGNISKEEKWQLFLTMPDNIILMLLEDINIDGNVITKEDELKFLRLLSNTDLTNTDAIVKMVDEFPPTIYDLVKPVIDMDKVLNIVILLAILYVLSSLFNYIQGFLLCTVSNNYALNLRTRITNKINNLPLKFFDSHEMGDILSRITNDVDQIAMNLNQSLGSLVHSITLFIGSVIMMFYTNWIMALTAICSSLIGFILMFIILNKSQKYFNQKQVELGNLNAHIEEIYSGQLIVKAYNGEKQAKNEFDRLNKRLYDCNKKSQFLSGLMQPLMGFIGNFGYVCVCIAGVLLVMNDVISFGIIVAFMIYVRLFTNPLSQIAQATTGLQSATAASERVFEFLNETEMPLQTNIKKVLKKEDVVGNVTFDNVVFGYNPDKMIIKNFSAEVHSGEKVAIVGPTGAGKTTMVNLLMKFYDINSGNILIDKTSIKDLTRENIHDLFTMVLQDTWLFHGTVRDNIRFNRENVSDDEIWEALKIVGVDHFIKTLPGGLDAIIDDGDSVSQGQKQLLTIARGMLNKTPFLILDEATSNVDTRTEELVQKAMDKLAAGRTSFIIAHRLSTIRNANLILVMKDGNIIESGNHDELIAKNGFYAELYNAQFKK